ncbi:uridine phosphorylase [Ruminiclostridium sufflavum DSM 19573]|uniref:Uridine phosphorylase n=1 Tax=Ruminiclostridium sufflavum DSM 19573 TaxID=1121337 RepID=A0A318XQE4_9FIRM|nr:nucleoside phosphorylase [Ruminiclostridium sufflavum]PYG90305.1 uridine phosphorylase [Ruminiclostridium sufflavum DSM 19573]
MNYTSAAAPKYDGKVPHLRCGREDIGEIILLPGDPGRIKMFEDLFDDFKVLSTNREFTIATGYYKGLKISVCSTGIGAPSTEIAVLELISLGARALIRIGGTGTIKEEIDCEDMILNTGAMRLGGASTFYAPQEYPAIASFEVVDSLKRACEKNEHKYHMGICASVGSFYHGQGREVPFELNYDGTKVLKEYSRLGILNFEMEAETIFTLSSIYGVLAGSICTVHCNRITDRWLIDNEKAQKKMCETALLGALNLNNLYLNKL